MSHPPTSRLTLPGPRPRFPGELLLRIRRDRLALLRELARDYGDVAGVRIGRQQIVMLTHPDDIRDVLVTHGRQFIKGRALERAKLLVGEGILTSEGEIHLRQRRLLQPAFHRTRLAGYARQMSAWSARVRDAWQDGATLDVHAEMMRLTLNIVAATLFSAEVDSETAEIAQALDDAFDAFDFGFGVLTPITDRLPTPRNRRFARARERLDAVIFRLIAERRALKDDRGDLLSMLLAATDSEGDGAGMTDVQVRDEAMTLFIAGHETTANLLTWTWLCLARHPEAEAALHAELDRVLPDDRLPTMDDLPALPYTRNVLAESMRLFPPAYIIGRRSTAPYRVRHYDLPARTIFIMPQLFVHRDPRWWPEPERFRPERWAEPDESRPKFAYFPFGAGTRICIGEQFAWMEGTLALATLARRWRVRVPGPDPELEPIITLRPKGGMPGRLERR
jgi:cytochrome P450